jgi:ADP-heptose:LPS heptosyltransferase
MHIAAAVGCPVVSLWGATAPERSAPWGNADFVMRGEIPCHPCYLRDCPIGRECMWRIAPNEVAAMVRRAMRAGRNAAMPIAPHDDANSDAGAMSLQLARRA